MSVAPPPFPLGAAVECLDCGTFTFTDDPNDPCVDCGSTNTDPVEVIDCPLADPDDQCRDAAHRWSLGVHVISTEHA